MDAFNHVYVTPFIDLPGHTAGASRHFLTTARPCGVPLAGHRLVITVSKTLRFCDCSRDVFEAPERELDFSGALRFFGAMNGGARRQYVATFKAGALIGIEEA